MSNDRSEDDGLLDILVSGIQRGEAAKQDIGQHAYEGRSGPQRLMSMLQATSVYEKVDGPIMENKVYWKILQAKWHRKWPDPCPGCFDTM